MGAEGQDIKERLEVAKKEITSLSLGEGQWERSHLTVRRFPEPCCHRWLFVGSIRKWSACGWLVVQLDHDEEMGPMHGMYGTLEADLEVQRTVERAELTAFLCLFR